MHYSLIVEALLVAGGLTSPLLPRQDVVWVTELVTVAKTWHHDHWSYPASSTSAGSMTSATSGTSTGALPAEISSDAPSVVPSESPVGTSTTQQAPSSPTTSAAASISSVAASSPLGSVTPKASLSIPASGQPSGDGTATIFPSTSPVPVPAAGVTVSATKLPITPSVGPGGNPVAPSATTQTYVDMCKSPSAALPRLATPTDDSLADWFLYYHNIHRRNHSAPDMIWSTELEKDAAILFGEYATEGKSGHIMGINGDTYGQNLASAQFWSSGSAATYGDYVVSNQQAANGSAAMWYHEGDNLSAAAWAAIEAKTTNSHFTQMISPVSTLLGCAVSQSGYTSANGYSNGYSVACNYGNNKLNDPGDTPGLCHPQVGP